MISEKRAKEILSYMVDHGEQKTIEHYRITNETLYRYLRLANFKKEGKTVVPKILLFDVETFPLKLYSWTLWKPKLSYTNIIEDWALVSWSAKWLFAPDVMSDVLIPEEAVARDDKRICKSMWPLLDQADVVISHNGINFDHKRLNTRFLLNKIAPPMPYQVIDTLRTSMGKFAFTSNRLDYLGQLIARKHKLATDFDLWVRCDHGNKDALTYMRQYNEGDVLLLEDVYVEMRPWVSGHPNIALIAECEHEACPVCGSSNLQEVGYYRTNAGASESLRCLNCGAPSRRRYSVLDKTRKKNLLSPIPR